MIDKKALRKLSKELPYGYTTTIRTRLMSKNPDMAPFSTDYIRKVLDPDDSRQNRIIIDEAILLRDEIKKDKDDLESRIFQS